MFRGRTAELPVGFDGQNGAENLSLVGPDQLTEARNISFASGSLTKDGGALKFNSTALGAPSVITGGYEYYPTPTTQRIIAVLSNGGAFKDDGTGAFGVDLTNVIGAQSWGATDIPVFVEGGKEATANNKKLFIFTGADAVHVLSADGVELAPIGGNAPADWSAGNPTCGANHEGRLWGAGNSNSPYRVYFSATSDHENFTTISGPSGSGTLNIFPGEGERVNALISYKGMLVVAKYPRGLYAIDTSDVQSIGNWRVIRLSGSVGFAGARSWCLAEDSIVFMDPTGVFHVLTATDRFGSFQINSISKRVWFEQWAQNNLSQSRYPHCRAIYYPAKKEAHFALSATGGTVNNRRIIWDFNRELPRWRYNTFPSGAVDLFTVRDSNGIERPFAGDNVGFVHRLDYSTKSDNGTGYSTEFKTGEIDLSGVVDDVAPNHRKNGRFLELAVNPKGVWDLSITVAWDGAQQQPIGYSMAGSGVGLGTFVIGTNVLGGQELVTVRHRITGSGKRFSIQALQTGADQDFSVNKFSIDYDIASRDVSP